MAELRLIGGTDTERGKRSERTFNAIVGARLKAVRLGKTAPPSLADVGRELGIDETTVLRHEGGAIPLTVVRAWRWCRFLGIELRDVIG